MDTVMISIQRLHVRSWGKGLLTPKKTNVPKPILLIIVGVTCPTTHNLMSHFLTTWGNAGWAHR